LTVELIVLAASAGGLDALSAVFAPLPADFPVPLVAVLHRTAHGPSMLADVLNRRTSLRVKAAEAGELLLPGAAYLAPPGHHLTVTTHRRFALHEGPLVQHTRPAADPLFLSAAAVYGAHVIAVVLTGGLHDAAEGARAIGQAGGVVLAQDEATSQSFSMPEATIATGEVDAILAIEDIAPTLVRLIRASHQ
jgi:two-component system chemotaxis response regulator CheB